MMKALYLGHRLRESKNALADAKKKKIELQNRREELEKAIDAVDTDTPIERRNEIEKQVDEWDQENTENEAELSKLDKVIREMEDELAAEEAAQNTEYAPARQERETWKEKTMRKNNFYGMNLQERDAFFNRSDVKGYLNEVRTSIKEKRAINNVGLTIPTVMLDVLRENIESYSKMYKHVRAVRISGDGRQLIMGTIPEGIWTDCCANLNELTLGFNDLEMNCYRVGGFFAICNANLEDSDIDLANEIFKALGQAIGIALDKAILFGRNTNNALLMPLGVASRLAQTSQPDSYPATARPWVDLHTSNIKNISNSNTGIALFQSILMNMIAAKNRYGNGKLVHVMNETTYTYLMAQAMSFDAKGAIVSNFANLDASGAIVNGIANKVMPVIGGTIEILNFMPDYVMISGYFDCYTLAERAGAKFATSEHIKFFQDQTVMKGTARYDGAPAIAEAFVMIGINSTSPDATAVTFAPDEANSVQSIALNTATAAVTAATGTNHTVQLFAITAPGSGTVSWTSSSTGKATVDDNGVVTGVASGSSTITATCDGKTASCVVTVS